MTVARMEKLASYRAYPEPEMRERARRFYEDMRRRRTVREFSDRPAPREVLEWALKTAGSAPSGANLQPWRFTVITDPTVKAKLRVAAEEEERAFYDGRAPAEWLEALAPLGTDANKPFLESGAALIAVFAQRHGMLPDGRKVKHYYVPESVGIATGFLLLALHNAGLATLTHTPSPMGFLNEICGRPDHEKPYMLIVAGYPADDAMVPVAGGLKKSLDEIATWL